MPASPLFVLVALGSNLGDSRALLREAMDRLAAWSSTPIRRSSLWISAPVDCPPGSPAFLNAAVGLTPFPGETPETLLARLQELEQEFGRRPKVVLNEPRPLDLDLIVFGEERRDTPRLILPHPRAHLRRFVLEPWLEVEAGATVPGLNPTVADLLHTLREAEAQAGRGQECRRLDEVTFSPRERGKPRS